MSSSSESNSQDELASTSAVVNRRSIRRRKRRKVFGTQESDDEEMEVRAPISKCLTRKGFETLNVQEISNDIYQLRDLDKKIDPNMECKLLHGGDIEFSFGMEYKSVYGDCIIIGKRDLDDIIIVKFKNFSGVGYLNANSIYL